MNVTVTIDGSLYAITIGVDVEKRQWFALVSDETGNFLGTEEDYDDAETALIEGLAAAARPHMSMHPMGSFS